MSKILAIETSSEVASAALLIDQQVIQRQTVGVMNHSHTILPMVQSLLEEANLSLQSCDAIAFGCGPGSFTGVRTACGVAQGLAFGSDLPVIPIVTLLALAQTGKTLLGATEVLAAIDARMEEVYWAQYRYDATVQAWQTLLEPALCAPALLAPQMVQGLTFVGSGFKAYATRFNFPTNMLQPELQSAQNIIPQADAVARLAQIELAAGRYYAAEYAQPLYLRNKVAMTTLERQAQRPA